MNKKKIVVRKQKGFSIVSFIFPEVSDKSSRITILSKLKSVSGESFAEVLVALLIAGLGIMMLATMISASSRITLQSGDTEAGRIESINAIEAVLAGNSSNVSSVSSKSASLSISLSGGDSSIQIGSSKTTNVTVYTVSDSSDSLDGYETLTVYLTS